MGDDDAIEVERAASAVTPSSTAPFSPRPGRQSTSAPGCRRPRGDLVVVAHDEDRQRSRRRDDAIGHVGERATRARSASSAEASRTFAWRKLLTGTSTAARTAASLWSRVDADPQGRRRARATRAGRGRRARGACRATDGAWRLDWWVGRRRSLARPFASEASVRHRAVDGDARCSRPRCESTAETCASGCYGAVERTASSRWSRWRTTRRCPSRSRSRCEAHGPTLLSPRARDRGARGPTGTDGATGRCVGVPARRTTRCSGSRVPLTTGDRPMWPARAADRRAGRLPGGARRSNEASGSTRPGSWPGRFALARVAAAARR